MKKRIFALALALCLMLSLVPTMVFAEGCTHTHSDECYYTTKCIHEHTEACGTDGKDCTHKCTVESGCITMKKDCKHTHNDDCGYKAAVEEVKCGCTDTNKDGSIKHSENCGYQAAVPEVKCNHVCSIKSGCYKLQCTHAEEGQHDEKCGYKETTLTTAAPTSLQDQINDAEENGTVKLDKDEELTTTLEIKKALTLDLNGHNITMTGEGDTISASYGVTMTIANSSDTPATIYGGFDVNPDLAENICKVIFWIDDSTVYATQFVKKGKTVAEPTAPKKEGHTFVEWQQWTWTFDENENQYQAWSKYAFSETVSGDKELKAKFESNPSSISYTITFDPNGGTLDDSKKTATANEENEYMITTLPTPTRDGYKFLGWFTQAEGGEEIKPKVKTYDADTTLYAHWESEAPTPTECTVTFDANGGSVTPENATTAGKLEKLPEPTRTGYTFDGWYTAKVDGTEVTKDTAYSENTTIYAHWTANTYTIVFKNGTSQKMQKMTYGVEAELEANTFTKDGYTFADWNTQENGKGTTYTDKQKVSNLTDKNEDEVVLYAQWVKDSIPELTPVTSLTFYQSGYEYNKNVIDLKLQSSTGNKGITFPDGLEYGDDFGLSTEQNLASASKVTNGEIKAKTQYYLYVQFEAKEGYTLDGLEAENVKLDGEKAVKLTVKDDTATAVFELPRIFLIKATAGSNGKIEPSGTVAVFEGENQTFTITPNTGYGISTMKIDKKSQTTKKTYTFKDVDDSHEITVTFAKSNGSAKTGDDLRLIWLAGAGVLSLAALVAIVIIHNKKKNSK